MAEVERILDMHSDRKPAEMKSPRNCLKAARVWLWSWTWKTRWRKRRTALRVLERAARGQGFAQFFADTAALAKDRESWFEELLGVFYGLLSDLLELNAGVRSQLMRNPHLTKELEALARTWISAWIRQAIAGMDRLAAVCGAI